MAQIVRNSESLFRIHAFSGLNESPSGDTELNYGEAAECRNFRVTREGSLQVRPGSKTLWQFDGPVEGIWQGRVSDRAVKVAAAGGKLWLLGAPGEATELGNIGPGGCRFFGFGRKLYILTGKRYLVWSGYGQVTDVEGYRPVVAVSVPPEGGGATLEAVNRLNGLRRGFFSPDGTKKVFQLPEGELAGVDYVRVRATGEHLKFTADKKNGKVTLTAVPAAGTNTLEIGWSKGGGTRGEVLACRFFELYSGVTDNRVFLYGGGDNRAFFSGIDYDGAATAEYFPEGNVLKAGSDNTPITGMIRHHSKLLVFKPDGTFSVQTGTATLENGEEIPTFYLTPLQREMGSDAAGQVTLVDNDPRTLWGGGVYTWKSASSLGSMDERVGQRISRRIEESLGEMELSEAVVFDDELGREWYVSQGGVTLVHNYSRDCWYRYEGLSPRCFGKLDGAVCFGTAEGELKKLSRAYRNDDGKPIQAFWRSGSMSMEKAHRRKWGKYLWVGLKPESGAAVTVTTRTDARTACPAGVARASLMNYSNVNFGHWSYVTNRQPKVRRLKPWAGPGSFEQIILESCSASETATVLSLEGTVRLGRYSR